MSPEEVLVGWFSELWIYVLNLVSFASIIFYIWIHKAPEYGSKTDPDARHWLRAGGIPRARRSRPKTDWLRNTEKYPVAWILHNQSQTRPCISRSYLCTKLWVNSNEKIYLSRIRKNRIRIEFSNNYAKISTHILCSERLPTSTPSRRSSPPTGMPASPSTSTPCTQTHPLCTQRTQTPPTLHLGDFVRTCITENSLL